MFTSTYRINNGRTFAGVTGRSHNSVLQRTRRLFSGQGYRAVPAESSTGHLVLSNGTDRAVIDVDEGHGWYIVGALTGEAMSGPYPSEAAATSAYYDMGSPYTGMIERR